MRPLARRRLRHLPENKGDALSWLLALTAKIRSEPATRSGSGNLFHREAQTKGAPSATMKAACSLTVQLRVLVGQHRVIYVGRDEKTRPARLDQVPDHRHRLDHRQRSKGNAPNPNRVENPCSRLIHIPRSMSVVLIARISDDLSDQLWAPYMPSSLGISYRPVDLVCTPPGLSSPHLLMIKQTRATYGRATARRINPRSPGCRKCQRSKLINCEVVRLPLRWRH